MNKKLYCTLDTETVGGASNPTGVYHLGGILHDRDGNIIGCFNYLIAENLETILDDDYTKKNFDLYQEMLEEGTATLIDTEENAIRVINSLLEFYNVGTMVAFNSGFDYVKTCCKELLKDREFIDLWLASLQTLAIRKKFVNFCKESGRHNEKGTCRTNAETFYAYLTDNVNYCEEHTALEDSKIEFEIFKACMQSHKAFTKNCHCWDFENKWLLFPKIK